MKYLKIENNKAFFRLDDEEDSWKEIDQITKDDLMKLLDLAIDENFEMDSYNEDILGHKAHAIVYKNLFDKFTELSSERSRFKDESENLFKEAFKKYSDPESE